jgi:hypothetical protein
MGTLSAPQFRSVLSHKIYRYELEKLYAASLPLTTPREFRRLYSVRQILASRN